MSIYDQVQEAAAYVQQQTQEAPRVGVVLGSGLGAFADRLDDRVVIDYNDIPHFPVSAVAGHAGELVLGRMGGVPLAVLSGRVHYYEGWEMSVVAFPIRVLASLGVKSAIITNAAGAVNPAYEPGDFMIITDHINLTGQNPLRGAHDSRLGLRFPDMSQAYYQGGRRALHEAAREVSVSLREGVYAGLGGPSYETPAEIRMLQVLGADTVGMSTVAEVIVASQCGIRVAGLSIITNRAAGLGQAVLTHDEVKEVADRVASVLCELLARAAVKLA